MSNPASYQAILEAHHWDKLPFCDQYGYYYDKDDATIHISNGGSWSYGVEHGLTPASLEAMLIRRGL